MKIDGLLIENFRGIRRVHVPSLGETVIIAGQNGSGKSCIFDAIRLLKSVYGGYQQNEWQNWLGEFSIAPNASAESLRGMFNDPSKQITIELSFKLRDEEKAFIHANAESVLTDAVWRAILPEAFQYGAYRIALFASQFREREPEVRDRVAQDVPKLREELTKETLQGTVVVPPGGTIRLSTSTALSAIFSTYRPQEIGVIDYHGPQRHYGRELVQAINISLDQESQRDRQHALYNYSNKYNNIKSELAGSYVKEMFTKEAGGEAKYKGMTATLQDLFATFFPDKHFDGPVPTLSGNLSFPVKTAAGAEHDLDDLSSGEKEILYGYLRIRSSAPKYSIILLDEPELHLNPRLVRFLPEFYRKHLGEALQNQIWLVSHSDALLRETVGKPGFDVFHMQPASIMQGGTVSSKIGLNQLKPLNARSDLDFVMTDLVGDLAAYEPGRKAIIFEGGGDTDFDQWMTLKLFPELSQYANLISGSNKAKVRALHEVLNRAYERGDLKTKFFAVVDKDFDVGERGKSEAVTIHHWDVYHIENYLLDDEIIARAVGALSPGGLTSEEVSEALRLAARETVPFAVRHQLSEHVSRELTAAIDLKSNPDAEDFSAEILSAADRSLGRLSKLRSGSISEKKVRDLEATIRKDIEKSFGDGTWRSKLPGRSILKAYSNRLARGISYETLRTMIVNRMVEDAHQPAGMKKVLDAIIAS